jgi:hypothetical protein
MGRVTTGRSLRDPTVLQRTDGQTAAVLPFGTQNHFSSGQDFDSSHCGALYSVAAFWTVYKWSSFFFYAETTLQPVLERVISLQGPLTPHPRYLRVCVIG